MPQETKSFPDPNTDPNDVTQGMALTPTSDDAMRSALEIARDYRGDVEIELNDGNRIAGFVFNVDWDGPQGHTLQLDLPEDAQRMSCPASDIKAIHLTGRDPAAGKSWENWVRRYAEKKLAGEEASIQSEKLD